MSNFDFVEEGFVHITSDGKYINRNVRREHGMPRSYEISLVSDASDAILVDGKMSYHNDQLSYSGVNVEGILANSKCFKVRKVCGMFETHLEVLEEINV